MALIKCPECGRENVSDSAKACPGCGFQIYDYFHGSEKTHNESSTYLSTAEPSQNADSNSNNTNKSGQAKFIIIGVIVVAVIWEIWYSSTRCAYSGCNEHKAAYGSYCYYHQSLLNSYSSYGSSSYNYDSRSKYDLIISDVIVHTNSSSSYCTGTIKNNGDESFRFVQVKGAFKDRNGNTIETGDSYAVGSEGLEPGESTTFKIYCDKNSSINSCTVTVYDYD